MRPVYVIRLDELRQDLEEEFVIEPVPIAEPCGRQPVARRRATRGRARDRARPAPVVLLPGPQRGGQPRGAHRGGPGDAAGLAETFEIIAVDDGSRDAHTGDRRRAGRGAPRPRPRRPPPDEPRLRRRAPLGLRGPRATSSSPSPTATASSSVADLGRLTERLAGRDQPDVVVGFRIKRADPLVRTAYARLYRLANRIFFGLQVTRRRLRLQAVPARGARGRLRVESGGAFFSAELLIKLRAAGRSVVEVGVPHYPRTAGSPTGAKPSVVLRAVKDFWLLRLRMWANRSLALRAGQPILGAEPPVA